ncbi:MULTISPECIES: A/G-specific adenine glycosylase [Butyricimonas]|uniref:A/G-specific adenine glycosylase n=1 Tax=Butyricimonas TaxID=574697 RepID=UPI0007FB455E|nr:MULTISPECIES: A/G-specific adenine glycosylase [Butyricimonas]
MEDREISGILIHWYGKNKRELPWRETNDPYLIWISEIILQQTRVVQGLDYFNRFVRRFPDVRSLAVADEDEVMKYWQGLGYYSRARNLHAAAKQIMSSCGGMFPRTREGVLALKGVGDYTSAAICSFAYRQPYATVDGNVYRVLARLFDIDTPIDSGEGKKYFTELAQSLLDERRPDLFNQAMMEFGALQCVPKSPDCTRCPLNGKCLAQASGRVERLPVKGGKTTVKSRYFNYLHIHGCGRTLLAKRTGNDIWRNLYEFPLVETMSSVSWGELQQVPEFGMLFDGMEGVSVKREFVAKKHVLSHRVIYAVFYEILVDSFSPAMRKYLLVPDAEVGNYAVSRLVQCYLEGIGDVCAPIGL